MNGSAPRRVHSERLWPAAWVWVAGPGVAASSGLVVLAVAAPVAAAVVAALLAAATAVALVASSALVQVGDGRLRAGRAQIPVRLLGRVRALDAAQVTALRGRDGDARAYLCQRGWIPRGVLVELADPDDPTPYWLVSSRRPQQLAAAIEQARGEPPSGSSGQAHSRQTG